MEAILKELFVDTVTSLNHINHYKLTDFSGTETHDLHLSYSLPGGGSSRSTIIDVWLVLCNRGINRIFIVSKATMSPVLDLNRKNNWRDEDIISFMDN